MKRNQMIRQIVSFLLVCMMLAHLTGCSVMEPQSVQAANLMEEVKAGNVTGKTPDATFIHAQMKFSTELFQAVAVESGEENMLISPLSIVLALAMTANGADGATKEEMETVLAEGMSVDTLNEYLYGYVNALPSGEKYKLQIANSIWFRDQEERLTVEQDFLQKNADYYAAAAYKAVFDQKTVQDINHWVKENTDGMIEKVVEKIDDASMLYLINALVFDAEWQEVYEKNDIFDTDFYAIGGEKRKVEMMVSGESWYLDDGKAIGFIKNYKDGKYSFVALLPNGGIGISDYISGLTSEELYQTVKDAQNKRVIAYLPKFSYDYGISMKEILKGLGMPTAFDFQDADFSKMGRSSDGNLFIGEVLHKTFITVDERGTKVGAVTVVEMANGSALEQEPPKEVRLDRPFVYFIIDNTTSLPVFMGTVMDIQK